MNDYCWELNLANPIYIAFRMKRFSDMNGAGLSNSGIGDMISSLLH